MISYIWNKIKSLFIPEKQDPHIVLYEEVKPEHCTKHNRYRKNCLACREVVA
tara:strand:+ start:890 stop:1045 length:156 start_codon:yes stop_codon:yes gene_type:complete